MQKSLILKTQRKGAKEKRTQKDTLCPLFFHFSVFSMLSRLCVRLDDPVIHGWERALYLSDINWRESGNWRELRNWTELGK